MADGTEEIFEITVRPGKPYTVEARWRGQSETAIAPRPRDMEGDLRELQTALHIGLPMRGAPAQPAKAASEPRIIEGIGTRLFDLLFRRDVFTLYSEARDWAAEADGRISLHVRLTEEMRELGVLPWETLYHAERREYLAISDRVGLTRTAEDFVKAVRKTPKLRILCAIADATDDGGGTEGGGRLDPLMFDRELMWMEQAISELRQAGQVHFEVVKASLGEVEDRLRSRRHSGWDVFHFIGHGGFDDRRGQGYLVFVQDGSRAGERVYAEDLGPLLSFKGGPRLVLLNSCEGFQSRTGDIFSSTAGHLAFSDIPCVVAMQFVITSHAAQEFSRRFYSDLVAGESVNQAVRFARMGMKRYGPEWITPVLFSRSASGMIFELPKVVAP